MNKKEFSVYLHKPHLIDKHAEIALQEVVTDFPYFHAAHQLLLKAHQNNGSYHFEKQLPITSLLHGNRALLYAYLKESLVREFEFVAQNDLANAEEVLREWIGEEGEDEIENEVENEVEIEVEVEVENEVEVSDSEARFGIVEEVNVEDARVKLEAPEVDDLADLAFQNFEEKYLGKEELGDSAVNISDSKAAKVEVVAVDKEEMVEENKAEELPITMEEEKIISMIEPHDFLTWLQAKKTKANQELKSEEKKEEEHSKEELIDQTSNNQGGEKRIRKFNALIDKFIETSPSISKPQPTKFYNPAQKARESVTENFDMVTETLAKIYVKQNNYKKAILVYEKLSLLYPEKIEYFSNQISELQALLK